MLVVLDPGLEDADHAAQFVGRTARCPRATARPLRRRPAHRRRPRRGQLRALAARGGLRRVDDARAAASPTRPTTARRAPRATSRARSRARTRSSGRTRGGRSSRHRAADPHERDEARRRGEDVRAVDARRDLLRPGAARHRRQRAAAAGRRLRRSRASTTCARCGNADTIRADTEDAERVVLVGGSYIATEVAASLTLLGKRCSLLMQEDVRCRAAFGETAGRFFQGVLEEHGVESCTAARTWRASRATGERVTRAVVARAASSSTCDAVVIGVGRRARRDARPRRRAGPRARRAACCATRGCRPRRDGVFAAGDICEYDSVVHGERRCGSSTGTSPSTTARPRR